MRVRIPYRELKKLIIMKHSVVKFKKDDDGSRVVNDKWHLSVNQGGASQKLCTGEVFGFGESQAVFEEKHVSKNSVTCQTCLNTIRYFKNLDIK